MGQAKVIYCSPYHMFYLLWGYQSEMDEIGNMWSCLQPCWTDFWWCLTIVPTWLETQCTNRIIHFLKMKCVHSVVATVCLVGHSVLLYYVVHWMCGTRTWQREFFASLWLLQWESWCFPLSLGFCRWTLQGFRSSAIECSVLPVADFCFVFERSVTCFISDCVWPKSCCVF